MPRAPLTLQLSSSGLDGLTKAAHKDRVKTVSVRKEDLAALISDHTNALGRLGPRGYVEKDEEVV